VRRQQADREGGDAHQQQRHHEDVLAAEPVAIVAEDHPAQWPCDKAHGVRREGQQGADQRLEAREEELIEHQRRSGAVNEEVVPLQRSADQARNNHTAY